jgi:hypothetical protein
MNKFKGVNQQQDSAITDPHHPPPADTDSHYPFSHTAMVSYAAICMG